MKHLHIQNIDASDVLSETIELPSMEERELASLLDPNGRNLVEFWFDGASKMFSQSRDKIRNRASFETTNFTAGPTPFTFSTKAGVEGINVFSSWFNVQRAEAGDWTYAFAGVLTIPAVGANYGLLGNLTTKALGYVNQPNVRVSQTGLVQVFTTSANTATHISYTADIAVLYGVPVTIVLSQSVEKGLTLFINGIQVATAVTTGAKLPSTGISIDWFRSVAGSAQTKGWVGTSLLLSEDITKSPYQIQVVEAYLSTKKGS